MTSSFIVPKIHIPWWGVPALLWREIILERLYCFCWNFHRFLDYSSFPYTFPSSMENREMFFKIGLWFRWPWSFSAERKISTGVSEFEKWNIFPSFSLHYLQKDGGSWLDGSIGWLLFRKSRHSPRHQPYSPARFWVPTIFPAWNAWLPSTRFWVRHS